MIKVQVRPNEPLESALRRFKRQCNYAGIFRLAKKYSFFEKRSDKRRREGRERLRSIQRAMRKTEPRGRRGRGRGRRRSKMRTSTVTPESARLQAEQAETGELQVTPETIPVPQAPDTNASSAGVQNPAAEVPNAEVPNAEVPSAEAPTELSSPQEAES